MANITAPATFAYFGGSLRAMRLVPARFRFTASSSLLSGTETSIAAQVAVPELDRLTFADRMEGESDASFMRRAAIWQSSMEGIEDALAAQNIRIVELEQIVARLTAVEVKAETANDNAVAAKTTAEAVKVATRDTLETVSPGSGDTFIDNLRPDEAFP